MWIAVITSVFICEFCIPREAYDAVRDWGKSGRVNGRNNYAYSCIGNSYEVRTVPMVPGGEITQMLNVGADMLEDGELVVGVVFGTYNRSNQGEVSVELRQGNNRWSHSCMMDELNDLEMYHVSFSTEELAIGEAQIVLWADAGGNDNGIAAITVWNAGINDRNKNDINNFRHNKASEVFGDMFVGETAGQGILLMELYTR